MRLKSRSYAKLQNYIYCTELQNKIKLKNEDIDCEIYLVLREYYNKDKMKML